MQSRIGMVCIFVARSVSPRGRLRRPLVARGDFAVFAVFAVFALIVVIRHGANA
jgi:hypothetical protein